MSGATENSNESTTLSYIDFSRKHWVNEHKILEQLSSVNLQIKKFKNGNNLNTDIIIFADGDCFSSPAYGEILNLLDEGFQHSILILNDDYRIDYKKICQLTAAGLSAFFNAGDSANLSEKIISKVKRWRRIVEFVFSDFVKYRLIGECRNWLKLLTDVAETALYSRTPIFIYGESGTGKELIANFIYNILKSDNKAKDLIIVDCTNLSKDLAGSELFGHEKGSFTSAVSSRAGAIGLADKGMLFCDEISEVPSELQGSLLRVFQEKVYKPVGSNLWRRSDFRLVCASNKKIEKEVENGNFRADLYYRISGCVFNVPPLNSRKGDIMLLAKHFMKKYLNTEIAPDFDSSVVDLLKNRIYNGNIRELEQIISNIAIRYAGVGPVMITDVPEKELSAGMENNLPDLSNNYNDLIKRKLFEGYTLREIENFAGNTAIKIALNSSGGKVKEAARKLGITERTIQYRNYGNGAITKVN